MKKTERLLNDKLRQLPKPPLGHTGQWVGHGPGTSEGRWFETGEAIFFLFHFIGLRPDLSGLFIAQAHTLVCVQREEPLFVHPGDFFSSGLARCSVCNRCENFFSAAGAVKAISLIP